MVPYILPMRKAYNSNAMDIFKKVHTFRLSELSEQEYKEAHATIDSLIKKASTSIPDCLVPHNVQIAGTILSDFVYLVSVQVDNYAVTLEYMSSV
jgi:hypothetical protein